MIWRTYTRVSQSPVRQTFWKCAWGHNATFVPSRSVRSSFHQCNQQHPPYYYYESSPVQTMPRVRGRNFLPPATTCPIVIVVVVVVVVVVMVVRRSTRPRRRVAVVATTPRPLPVVVVPTTRSSRCCYWLVAVERHYLR